MPTPTAPHTRITASGQMPGGENWSSSFAVTVAGAAAAPVDLPGLSTDAAARWRTWITTGAAYAGPCSLLDVTCSNIDQNGIIEAQAQAAPATAGAGPGGQVLPNQIAAVVTLQTETPGPRGRGRMFLPALATPIAAGGRITTTVRDGMLSAAFTLIKGIADDLALRTTAGSVRVVVSSKPLLLAPTNRDVIRLRMGDVLDTQRRRRDKMPESYGMTPLTF